MFPVGDGDGRAFPERSAVFPRIGYLGELLEFVPEPARQLSRAVETEAQHLDDGRFSCATPTHNSGHPRAETDVERIAVSDAMRVPDGHRFYRKRRESVGIPGFRFAAPDGRRSAVRRGSAVQERETQSLDGWLSHLHPGVMRAGKPGTRRTGRMMGVRSEYFGPCQVALAIQFRFSRTGIEYFHGEQPVEVEHRRQRISR